jgi:hypothetical protein
MQKLLLLWDLVIEVYEFIYFSKIYRTYISVLYSHNEAGDCRDSIIASPYIFCAPSGDDYSKKPYEGKGKGRATEEDLRRIERDERGLPPESETDEDLTGIQGKGMASLTESSTDNHKKKQEEYDYLLAKYLQEEENQKSPPVDPLGEELHAKDKIEKLEDEVHKLTKTYNIAWDQYLSGNITGEEKSKLEKEVSTLKYEYYNKSNELNESKSAFENVYGYTPISRDISTEGDNSESEYDSSVPEHDEVPSTHNTQSNYDPQEGPSTRNIQPKDDPEEGTLTRNIQPNCDSDEERPHKKSKFSHDFISDSKKIFLPVFYRSFSFKSIFSLIRILLLILSISFTEFYLFINYLYFIDLYFINYIIIKLEGAIYLHKIWKKIKLFWKMSKSILKFAHDHHIYTLSFLVLFFLIFIFL